MAIVDELCLILEGGGEGGRVTNEISLSSQVVFLRYNKVSCLRHNAIL